MDQVTFGKTIKKDLQVFYQPEYISISATTFIRVNTDSRGL